jgi:hypothetical protein
VSPDNSKDAIVAILGAAVSLAGLLLIFSGFLISQAASLDPSRTPDQTLKSYSSAAKIGLIPFVGCLIVAAISLTWMLNESPALYASALVGFYALLVGSAGYGIYTICRFV